MKIKVTPLTFLYGFAMMPLYFVLLLTGGDFDGLVEWWIKSNGGRRVHD